MGKTMSRLRRAAAMIAAGVLLASGAAVAGAPAASADESCKHTPVADLCGEVRNKTGRTMHYTTTLNKEGAVGLCDVWNWGDDKTPSWEGRFKQVSCDQLDLGNGTIGGVNSGVDVDAFTFNHEGYHQRYSRIGEWHWRKKGVWTKFHSPEMADCEIRDNQIWCTLLVQRPG